MNYKDMGIEIFTSMNPVKLGYFYIMATTADRRKSKIRLYWNHGTWTTDGELYGNNIHKDNLESEFNDAKLYISDAMRLIQNKGKDSIVKWDSKQDKIQIGIDDAYKEYTDLINALHNNNKVKFYNTYNGQNKNAWRFTYMHPEGKYFDTYTVTREGMLIECFVKRDTSNYEKEITIKQIMNVLKKDLY